MKFLKKLSIRLIIIILALVAVGAPLIYLTLLNSPTVSAAWYNDNWNYRKAVNITTHTAAENNVYINLTGANDIDTSDTAKFQTDCGDLRFTDASGKLLQYYVVSGCSSADTVVHVFFTTMPAGAQTVYYYYGNPTVQNGGNSADFATEASSYTFTTIGSEEKAPSPVAYWKFDDGTGTNAQDSTANNNDGTISGATWQTEDQCISGKCLSFDGSNDVVTVSNTVSGIQTVSLWIKPITTSEQIIDINGTASISVSSGTISATSFTSPTIYVNGIVSSTLVANTWQYVTVTTGTALSGSAIKIGQISTNYGQAFIDDVKIYPYARTAAQILTDYNSRGSVKGTSINLGNIGIDGTAPIGHWKMDENTGTSANDTSGNARTGTINGNPIWAPGKYGAGLKMDGTGDDIQISDF